MREVVRRSRPEKFDVVDFTDELRTRSAKFASRIEHLDTGNEMW